MRRLFLINGVAVVACGIAMSACTSASTGKVSGPAECKASYTIDGSLVRVHVTEAGPATAKVVVTGDNGNKSGAKHAIASGQKGATFGVHSTPPVKRLEVTISEPSGTSSCFGVQGK